MGDGSEKRARRPYERPRLEPSSIFGAEAMTGSCCRTMGVCTQTTRDTQRVTTDVNKGTNSTSS